MLEHFFKADEIQRPKNIGNILSKSMDYLRLWYNMLGKLFEDKDENGEQNKNEGNYKFRETFEEFNDYELPNGQIKRKHIRCSYKKNDAMDVHFSSPKIEKKRSPDLNAIETFSDGMGGEEFENDLKIFNKFNKKFYVKEFLLYFLKITICWCIYYQK